MFTPVDLAARIDHAEARLSAAVGRGVLAQDPNRDAFVKEIGGGATVYTGPSSPMNKMIGVGFDGVPAPEQLDEVEELFRVRQSPLQAEVSTLADPVFAASLTRRGYVLENFENVLGRSLARVDLDAPVGSLIDVREMPPGEATHEWMDAAITGFQHPDGQGVQAAPLPAREQLDQALRPFLHVPSFRRYCAYIEGQLAGVASLRLDDRLGQLCGAATLPAFRRRGVQSLLLRRRLADAVQNGCEIALMTTQPGSKSQENGYRQGFLLLYSRAILVKHPE